MIFSRACLAGIFFLIPSTFGISKTDEDQFHATKTYIGNTMWIFGESGVYVYSPDGKEQKSHIDSEQICESKEDFDGPSYQYCRFSDIISDGKKYVWAAVNRGIPTIDLFDINTGSIVGTFESCHSPSSLEYHPLRDEIWVRCTDIVENSTIHTNLDVLSASNPSGEIETDILVKARALEEGLSSNGKSVIDNTLGDVGYITDMDLPSLFKVDLSTKSIIDTIEMTPPSNGLYEVAYSQVNKHIFVRSQICCTCGFEGADLGDSCGRRPGYNVTPTTGAFAGQTDVMGVCGSSCEGKKDVDTIGVYEFDTVTDTVVKTHVMEEGFGGDPYPSPDGKHIVLLGRNGGKTIRILEVGEQGLASRTLVDLELGFDRTGYETTSVAKDFAFVYKDGKTSIVFPSGTEHKVAIVEIPTGYVTSDAVKISYVTFNKEEFVKGRAPHGRYRRVEWAVGTDYVWVTDGSLEEIYVIDVVQKEVTTTLTEIDTGNLVSVQNYERTRQFEAQKQLVMDLYNDETAAIDIAAMVVGAIAIAVGICNYLYMMQMKKEFHANTAKDEPKHLLEESEEKASDNGMVSIN